MHALLKPNYAQNCAKIVSYLLRMLLCKHAKISLNDPGHPLPLPPQSKPDVTQKRHFTFSLLWAASSTSSCSSDASNAIIVDFEEWHTHRVLNSAKHSLWQNEEKIREIVVVVSFNHFFREFDFKLLFYNHFFWKERGKFVKYLLTFFLTFVTVNKAHSTLLLMVVVDTNPIIKDKHNLEIISKIFFKK